MKLNDEFTFFKNLILDILERRAILKKFEDEIKKTNLPNKNCIIMLVWYGYTISQLSDCRKFFDRNENAHSFQFVIKNIEDEQLKKRHTELFEIWKSKKLETVLNRYLLHADKQFSNIKTEVSVKILNEFIDDLEKYIKQIVDDLIKNYSDIGDLTSYGYLKEREREVDIFFEEIRKVS